METKQMILNTPKEITEVGEALRELMRNVAQVNKENGANWLKLPRIVKRSFAELIVAIKGVGEIKEELKEDAPMSVMGVLNNVALGVNDMTAINNGETIQMAAIEIYSEEKEQEIQKVMELFGE